MKRSAHRGSTLPVALIVVLVLGVMIAAAFEFTNALGRHTQGAGAVESAIAMADGSLDYLYANWRQIMRTSPNLAPTSSEFTGITVPTGYFQNMPQCTLKTFSLVAVDPLLQPLATATTTPPKQTGRGPGTFSYTYLASADVDVKVVSRNVTQKVRRVFQKRVQSPWNFAFFSQDVLEFQPNAPLTLTGWVHSNNNLYTGSDKLTLTDRLTTAGTWNIGFAPGDGAHTGVTPTSPSYPANEPPAQEDVFLAFGLDPKLINTTDTNPNNDSFRAIAQVPNASYTDPFTDQRYYNQAGIKVLMNGNNVTIMNAAGTICTAGSKGNDFAIFQAVNSALKSPDKFQDNREAATMSAWRFDVGALTSSNANWNNILYISDQSASTGNHKAIRVVNGNLLPKDGLTLVTDNPLYIQGDWNTGQNPPSSANNPDPSQPMASGYQWRPSAIIADAITVLSNSWQDGNSSKGLNQRTAGNTTINAALVSGNVPSGSKGNNYSGGGENFVRFLEDWTGKTFTYYGSMLQLFPSTLGIGTWGKANVYSPGQLKWYFDDNFTLTSPPGTAVMISYIQQRWYQE